MKLLATMRHIFKLALRQLEGFVASLFELMAVDLKTPEFSRLSRRLSESLKHLKYRKPDEISHIVIDSSGLKVFGEKELTLSQKRKPYHRRIWRKLHIAIDGTGIIRASKMTSNKVNDRACFETLIDAIGSEFIDEALADTGYDSHDAYKICQSRNIKTIIPPPRNAKISNSKKKNLNEMKQLIPLKQKEYMLGKQKTIMGEETGLKIRFTGSKLFLNASSYLEFGKIKKQNQR